MNMISELIQEPARDVRVAAKANVVVVGVVPQACRRRSVRREMARKSFFSSVTTILAGSHRVAWCWYSTTCGITTFVKSLSAAPA